MGILHLFATLLQLKVIHSANILGIMPLNGRSHFQMAEALFRGLAENGHNVDVVGHFPLKKPIPRYNDIPIKGNFDDLVNNLTVDFVAEKGYLDTLKLMSIVAGPGNCRQVLDTDALRKLKNTTKKYDLLITEFFVHDCMLGFSHLFNIPSVVLTTGVSLPWYSSYIGLPDNPSYIPNYLTPFTSSMSLMERITNTATCAFAKIWHDWSSITESNLIAKEFFGSNLPDLRLLINNVSLLIVNSHFSVQIARPTVPNFIEVAGLHINKNTSLSKHFQDLMQTDFKGIIYLSFGSMLLTESFPEHKIRALFRAFKRLPYKILWKATREKFPQHLEIPSNIQFAPWLPQMGILCHPNLKLFVSHGGMMGTLEALYCGVPVLGIPVFADQMLNIRNGVSRGLAVEVSYETMNEESLIAGLNLVLNNKRYEENVKRLSQLFKDRPASALESAIYWIEYVIRHNGAPHLRTAGADLPWYQYYLVDVVAVISGFVITLTFLIYYVILQIYNVTIKNVSKIKQH